MKADADGSLVGLKTRCCIALIAGLMMAAFTDVHQAQAQNLSHFISNLYGGQGITLANTPGPEEFNHAHHFSEQSIEALNALGSSVASGLNLTSFPSTAAVGFTYNIELGLPVATTESLGTILGERAETVGVGNFNLAATYSRLDFTNFNGKPLNDIQVFLPHIAEPNCTVQLCPGAPNNSGEFLLDKIRLDINLNISQDVFVLYGTYGITSNWDMTLVLPVIHTHALATSDATIIFNSNTDNGRQLHSFIGAPTNPHSVSGGDASGVGDLIVHTKYNFLRGDPTLPDLAVAGAVKTPSGDSSNLLGTGGTDLLGLLILSKQINWAAPHLNAGYQHAFGGFDKSAFVYAAGADFTFNPKVTTVVDFIGRVYSANQQLHDVGLGMKWNPMGNHVFSVDFLLPINKSSGLRTDFVATVGYQTTF
jgi:hypothetical protein